MNIKKNKIIKYLKTNKILIAFFAVLVIGVFFRLYKLDSIPFGLNNDAAWEGSAALDILRGNFKDYIPYATEGWRGEAIVRVIVAIFTLIFGNSPINIKLATTVFGIGILIPIYFLIKNLFNKNLALLTMFFIATSGWHIIFSRSGWRAISVPFFATLSFYFLFKGFENKKNGYFTASGIMLSIITFYTYDAGRIFPFLFFFWIFIEFISQKNFIKTYFIQLISLFLAFIVVSLPMIFYAINNWTNFIGRSDYLFVGHQIEKTGNLNPLFENIIKTLLLFNVSANGNDFFIYEPLLDDPAKILFLAGIVLLIFFSIIKGRKNYFFILCWLIFSLIPGIISSPNGNRTIGAIPAVYFIIALATYSLANFLFYFFNKIKIKTNYSTAIIIFVICVYSISNTYQTYFGPSRRDIVGFYPNTLVTSTYIKTIWDKYDIYLTDNYPRELLTYFLYKNSSPNAFAANYVWLENSNNFLAVVPSNYNNLAHNTPSDSQVLGAYTSLDKGLAFFMFDNDVNQEVANQLLKMYPNGQKFYIYNKTRDIYNVSSLVVLIPPN